MSNYITIDGGTTNTRIYLVVEGKVREGISLGCGVRHEQLRQRIAEGMRSLLKRHRMTYSDVCCILASGMITSEYGLCPLAHILLPAGCRQLRETACEILLQDIAPIPFVFIRGMKTGKEDLSGADMMRGEETELMGLLEQCMAESIYVLPGTHSKIIAVDECAQVTDIKTLMSGELLDAVLKGTILQDAVDLSSARLCEPDLLKGYTYCKQNGINDALFKVRVLKNQHGGDNDCCYSFLLGVILRSEVESILTYPARKVLLGGQKQLRQALAVILKECSDKEIRLLSDEAVAASTPLGAVRIYETKI